MHNSTFELFPYLLLVIWMSSFITGLDFFLVYFYLILAIDGPYIFSTFLISWTDIRQFDIMLVDTVWLKFFTVGRPTLLYIFLANLALSICMLVNPTIFSSNFVTTLEFSILYLVLKTYSPCLSLLNLTIPLLLLTVKASSLCESYVTLYFLTKLVSENIFDMVLSEYHNLPYYGTIACIWFILDTTLVHRWSNWLPVLMSGNNWLLLKISIEDPLSSMMLFLRYSSAMMFCSSFALLYKSPRILLNSCANIVCAWMKFLAPIVHELTANMLSSLSLVDCSFFFSILQVRPLWIST